MTAPAPDRFEDFVKHGSLSAMSEALGISLSALKQHSRRLRWVERRAALPTPPPKPAKRRRSRPAATSQASEPTTAPAETEAAPGPSRAPGPRFTAKQRSQRAGLARGFDASATDTHGNVCYVDHHRHPSVYNELREAWISATGLDSDVFVPGAGIAVLVRDGQGRRVEIPPVSIAWENDGAEYIIAKGDPATLEIARGLRWADGPVPGFGHFQSRSRRVNERPPPRVESVESQAREYLSDPAKYDRARARPGHWWE